MPAIDSIAPRIPSAFRRAFAICASTALAAFSLSCATTQRPFPLRAPMWVDGDTRPLAHPPAAYWSALVWDAADHVAFRPWTRAALIEIVNPAVNVNALDEVPDSSWYTNRLSRSPMSPEQIAAGSCAGSVPPSTEEGWTVLSAKTNGATPGFIARAPDGKRYVLKADLDVQPEATTAGDVIGSRIFWAAGYSTSCNRVLNFDRGRFTLAADAHYDDSLNRRRRLTDAQLDIVFNTATRYPDGRYRLSVSRFIEGTPLGPFTYEGTRRDDPNDVVPHENRRELRAAYVLSAWLNHWDSREQNTLTTWTELPAGGGYVQHHMLDFSDTLGEVWTEDGISRRLGHSGYFSPRHIGADFFGLGLFDRAWDHSEVDPRGWIFAYFRTEDFQPDNWHAGYPNPAYDRMTEQDAAWMARILARYDDATIHALVGEAHLSHREWSERLEHVLRGRRDRLLARYLTRRSPLAEVAIVTADLLCGTDRGIESHVYRAASYTAAVRTNGPGAPRRDLQWTPPEGPRVCVRLVHRDIAASVPDGDPARHAVVELVVHPQGRSAIAPLFAHVYDLGRERGFALAGLER